MAQVSLERVDPRIEFDWVRNGPGRPIREDNFTARWAGFIQPSFPFREMPGQWAWTVLLEGFTERD